MGGFPNREERVRREWQEKRLRERRGGEERERARSCGSGSEPKSGGETDRQTDRERAALKYESTALKIEELENWTGQFGVVCGLYLEKTKSHQKGY